MIDSVRNLVLVMLMTAANKAKMRFTRPVQFNACISEETDNYYRTNVYEIITQSKCMRSHYTEVQAPRANVTYSLQDSLCISFFSDAVRKCPEKKQVMKKYFF